ncbi:CDP-glycerol glycerophosphotransferase family protein [Paenibacillus tritici]|uniref:CDP-glycerol glycerophosphotransferase family protein n=1 Tax=Paenibacillus tritici TaxID=1873425 RepID=A0ABX2DIQ0_9BACL|nr:CDP-glycerol glycerophosphotransferase family protein [Paenibacillus tritici]NQX44488.1 CDP-glycerol glycerophosphotransferase family protein [Paenibacillus tritici]
MSIYLSNYWSLYSEFLNITKDLKYRNISIGLMTNFYQQINDELRSEMGSPDFGLKLNHSSIHEQNQIQPFFEMMVAPLYQPIKSNLEGKILINLDYIRMSEQTFSEHFNEDHAVILSRSRVSELFGIPNLCSLNYKKDTRQASDELMERAADLFAEYKGHPAFSNEFFTQTFIHRIPSITDTIEMVFNLYNEIPVAAVMVGTTEDVASRALAVVAGIRGIPSVCLQHGILMGEEAFIPVFSSHVGIYGQYEHDWYTRRGLEAERIVITGHPRYDDIFTAQQTSKDSFRETYQLDPHKVTLLIATGPTLDEYKIRTLLTQLATQEPFQLIIKPHPWELSKKLISLYTEFEEKYENVHVVTDRKADTRDLVMKSDAVVATLSTVALEGLLFNKPVFVYKFIQANREYDYYDALDPYIQKEPADLTRMVADYFSSNKEQSNYKAVKDKFLQHSYQVEHSGRGLAELMDRLIQGRPKL